MNIYLGNLNYRVQEEDLQKRLEEYYLSQKVGYDVGFDFTAHDFFKKYKKVKGLYLIPSMIRDVLRGVKEQIKDLKD